MGEGQNVMLCASPINQMSIYLTQKKCLTLQSHIQA